MRYASIASVANTARRHVPLATSVGRLRIVNWGKVFGLDADLTVPAVQHMAKRGNRKAFLAILTRDKVLLMLFSGAIITGMVSIGILVIALMQLLS